MPFELFTNDRNSRQPKATIRSSGVMWLSSKIRDFLGDYKRTFLLYDQKNKLIGLKPTNEKENTLALTQHPNSRGTMVSVTSFCSNFGIKTDQTSSYKVSWNKKEGMAIIDLNSPLPVAKRGWKKIKGGTR